MITWTEAANDALEEHMSAIAPRLLAAGLVPAQMAIRLRMNINDELARAGLAVAGRAEVVDAIAKLGSGFVENLKRPEKSSGVLGWGGKGHQHSFGCGDSVDGVGGGGGDIDEFGDF